MQAIARSLGEHAELNSTYSEDGLLRHDRLDLGIAVATDSGLLVPVLRHANRLGLPELARAIEDLASRARDRSLAHEELQGATLTVDNTGAFGSLISQPIVPVGQVAIVTTEAIRRELRVVGDADGDAFAPRSVMLTSRSASTTARWTARRSARSWPTSRTTSRRTRRGSRSSSAQPRVVGGGAGRAGRRRAAVSVRTLAEHSMVRERRLA